jgi:hypothetical protein
MTWPQYPIFALAIYLIILAISARYEKPSK